MLVLVYRPLGDMNVVHEVAEMLMNSAVSKIKQLLIMHKLARYIAHRPTKLYKTMHCMCILMCVSQWVITDARHDSTANAYHTTVPCLSGR